MRMLFTCRPTMGHFQPLLPLATAARQRGHAVAFATGEPIATRARALGFDCETAGLSDTASRAARDQTGIVFRDLPPDQIRPFAFGRWFAGIEAPPRLADLDRICAGFRPDVVMHETAELAAPLAAASAGLPWVTVGFGVLIPSEVIALAAEVLAPLWQGRGLAVPPWGGLYKHLYVDPCPSTLQTAEIADLPAVIRIGLEAGADNAKAAERRAASRVYVTFGTLWNTSPAAVERMRLAVAGSADACADVVATTGSDTDPASLGPQPAHVRVERFIPQGELLPTCACVVAHGGSGTLLGALAWGLPLLILPQSADQFDNAKCATRAGVALSLMPADISRAAVADHVRRLLAEPAFAARAAEVRAELAAMPDVGAVLDRIEAVAASCSTPPRQGAS